MFSILFMWFTIDYFSLNDFIALSVLQLIIFFTSFILLKLVFNSKSYTAKYTTSQQGQRYFFWFCYFRLVDWTLNALLISVLGVPYYYSFVLTVLVILPVKFSLYFKKVFV